MRSKTWLVALFCPVALCRGLSVEEVNGVKTCTVTSLGWQRNDVPNIIQAFNDCGKNARVIFPQNNTYWIPEKLHATLDNVEVEWRGTCEFSKDTKYWRQNSYMIEFQNHRAGFIISGSGIRLNGFGTGRIDGNGDVWYDEDKGTSTEGLPMPFVLWSITDSSFDNFSITQSQFWSLNIMNGTNLTFGNITCSAFSNNAPDGVSWVQNADGFNTMDCRNITLNNFVYRGGGDCIAIKPRSHDIRINEIICEGGNGIAIGSLGQYLEDNTVEDVVIRNAEMIRYGWDMRWSVYIKTWIGHPVFQGDDDYESGGLPRGGGWGKVRNLLFENFSLSDVARGPYITPDNGNNNEKYEGTSRMEISDIMFRNFTGTLKSETGRLGEISCSHPFPCHNIRFEDMKLDAAPGKCRWHEAESISGLPGC